LTSVKRLLDKENPLARKVEINSQSINQGKNSLTSLIPWLDELAPGLIEGIVLFDDSQRIIYLNLRAEKISGWSREEACGKPISELFQIRDSNFLNQARRIPPNQVLQAGIRHPEGHPISIEMTVTPFATQFEDACVTALIFRDLREEDAAKKLRASFLANITHEFRTPLSSLNASVEFLLEEFNNLSRSEIETLLTSVYLSVTGLQTLIDNLLESIQIEAGRFNVSMRPTDLEKIINEANRVMSPLLNRRQQILHISLPDSLPKINCDPTRLIQVLVNLLSNASKYGPTQQSIDVDVKQINGGMVRISVLDRGPGIPRQERKNIFQRYYRLGTKSSAQDGIGLGLWVVRVIIEEHGGSIGVEDTPEGGANFWFTVPIVKVDA
jgi:PAS domain S-box-containing protein